MDIDSEFLKSLFWFLAGALSFKMMAALFLNAVRAILVEQTIVQALVLLKFTNDSHESILKLKYAWVRKSEEMKSRIPELRGMDKLTVDIWKVASINSLINSCPKSLRHVIKFVDWSTAMTYLGKALGERR